METRRLFEARRLIEVSLVLY